MSEERKSWHIHFNPCGIMAVEGFPLKRCTIDCKQANAMCFAKGAQKMAEYLLKEGTIDTERRDFRADFVNRIGEKVVDLEGNIVRLSRSNINSLVDSVVQKAQEIVTAINVCIEHTRPIPEDYIDNCSSEKREALFRLSELQDQAESFRGSREQAEELIEQMKTALGRAIELDLDEFGLVTRWALGYGLGERVLAKRGIPIRIVPTQPGVLIEER